MMSISDAETQSGNEHSPSDNENGSDYVHEYAQPENDKERDDDVEIEHVVDLDNPPAKSKCYDKRYFVARKHGKEENHGFRNPCPFPLKLQRIRMMKNLSALLKCLDLSFCAYVWLIF